MKVKRLQDIKPDHMLSIVEAIRLALYYDDRAVKWDPDKEVNGADFVEYVSQILDLCGLTPKED